MSTRKITPDLERKILAESAKGNSSRAIAAWLLKEHGVTVTHQYVGKLLHQTRLERADVTKAVVQATLLPLVAGDVKVLGDQQARLDADIVGFRERVQRAIEREKELEKNPERLPAAARMTDEASRTLLRAEDLLTKVTDRKLHYSGADGGEDDPEGTPRPTIMVPPESDD